MKKNSAILILLGIMPFCFISCKKVAKFFSKEISSETIERTSKEVGGEMVYGVGENTIRRMDVDELIEFIRKNNGPLANSFDKLDKSVQKNIKKAIDEDVTFLNHLLCSNTLLDDFGSLVKNAPKASKDVNLLKMYSKSVFDARRYGKKNMFEDITLKDFDGITVFYHKNNGKEFAKLKDAIMEITSKEYDNTKFIKDNIFNSELLPNSVYKVKGINGVTNVFNIDNYGRVYNFKHTGSISELDDIIKINDNILLGNEWKEFIGDFPIGLKQNFSINLSYQERNIYSDYLSVKFTKDNKQLIKKFRNLKKSAEKNMVKKEGKIIARKEGKEAMQYLSNNNPELKELVEKIIANPRTKTNWEEFIVEESADGKIILSHRGWPNSKIEVNGNVIKATAGAKNPKVYDGVNYSLNEFLSHRLPNKTYIIDDYMTIVTDELGRVKETTAIFEKDKIIQRYRGNLPEQGRVVESQGGNIAKDDGGHLIQMGMGGPNELINQVPMDIDLNRNAGKIWRKVEQFEIKEGWENGKKVITKRRPIYKGNSGRPTEIEIDVIVDGKHAVIDGKQCPFTIPNS